VNRSELLRELERCLADRQLVWFGTRGDDVESAAELRALSASFSLISAYTRRTAVKGMALEDLTGVRMDLDTFDLDTHPRDDAIVVLRQALLRTLARPSVIFAYRPSAFLSAVCFARKDRCQYLGLFGGHQQAFEHKPWVESAVARLGLPHVPWTYIADDDRIEATRFLRDGPIILRRSRTNGGVGIVRLDDQSRLEELWPDEDEAFVSVAPFIDNAVPVNVGGVVWRDGVTVHPASVQLIGIPGCTQRRFGYCGNDFGAVRELGRVTVEAIEQAVVQIGAWLRTSGYLGAFGVDFLVKDGVPLFTEVNPRFQGSTHLSCQISVSLDESCVLTEHLGAFLGLAAPPGRPLWDLAVSAEPVAHVVVHSVASTLAKVDPTELVEAALDTGRLSRADVRTRPELLTEPGGTVARLTVHNRLTATGFDLVGPLGEIIAAWAGVPSTGSSVVQRGSRVQTVSRLLEDGKLQGEERANQLPVPRFACFTGAVHRPQEIPEGTHPACRRAAMPGDAARCR
jgi:ATP-grasp domain